MHRSSPARVVYAGLTFSSVLATAGLLSAQAQPDATGLQAAAAAAISLPMVPIHTAAADGDVDYGIWGAGRTYKAGFRGGFVFVPYLGARYERNQSVAWRTATVRMGAVTLETGPAAARTQHTAARFEYRWPDVVEAYDLRPDGVEQTFVLSRRVADGDLVVTGAIESTLTTAPQAPRHGGVDFVDAAGRVVARYGAATVLDAAGRALPIDTAVGADGAITLTVPDAWLDAAEFPIVVDPLLTRQGVDTSADAVEDVEIARDDVSNNQLVAFTRRVSQSDTDLFAQLRSSDLTADLGVIFSDVTTSWDAGRAAIGVVEARRKWVIAFERRQILATVHVHSHSTSSTTHDTTVVSPGTGTAIDVGGGKSGDFAMIVYNNNASSSVSAKVQFVRYDGVNDTIGTPAIVTPDDSQFDRRFPRISELSDGTGDHWLCVWQEFDVQGTDQLWQTRGILFNDRGNAAVRRLTLTVPARPTHHQLGPVVAGADGRFLVGVTLRDSATAPGRTRERTGDLLHTTRVDWTFTGPLGLPRVGQKRIARAIGDGRYTDMTYDNRADTWWGGTFLDGTQLHGLLVHGFSGGVVDSATVLSRLGQQVVDVDVYFNDDAQRYALVTGDVGTDNPVRAQEFAYEAPGLASNYGVGCGGQISELGTLRAGNEAVFLNLDGATPNALCAFFLATASGVQPLDGFGLTGCQLLLDQGQIVGGVFTQTDATGHAFLQLPLPDAPAFRGFVFAQAAFSAPGANPAGLLVTEGLQFEVR